MLTPATDDAAQAACHRNCSLCSTPAADRIQRRQARLRALEEELAVHHAEHRPAMELEIARERAVTDIFVLQNCCAFQRQSQATAAT